MNNLERDHLYKFNMLDDPLFKTNARNFNFKYVPTAQFEKVIKNVQKDRLNKHKSLLWNEYTLQIPPPKSPPNKIQSPRKRRVFKTKSSTVKVLTERKKDVDKNLSELTINDEDVNINEPKIRVMSDEEIHNVIESAVKEILHNNNNDTEKNPTIKKNNHKTLIDKNEHTTELYQSEENYIQLEKNIENIKQVTEKYNQIEDKHTKNDKLEHKPKSFCLLKKGKIKEYDKPKDVHQKLNKLMDLTKTFEELDEKYKKYDELMDSPKSCEKLPYSTKKKEQEQDKSEIAQTNSFRNDISSISQTMDYENKMFIDVSSESSESDYEYEFKSPKNCQDISPRQNNCNYIELEINDEHYKINDYNSNQNSPNSKNQEVCVTPKLSSDCLQKVSPKSFRSSNRSYSPDKELQIMTPNNLLDHILMTKKDELQKRSKFHMDLEAIMNMKVPVRHEQDNCHFNHDLETENSIINYDEEDSGSDYVAPEIPLAQTESFNKEQFVNVPPSTNSKRSSGRARSPLEKSVVPTDTSINHTERTLNYTGRSIDYTERSTNQNEKSLNNNEISVNPNERSVNHTERSLNNNETVINQTEVLSGLPNKLVSSNRTGKLSGYAEKSSIQTDSTSVKYMKISKIKNQAIQQCESKKIVSKLESKRSSSPSNKKINIETRKNRVSDNFVKINTPKISRPIDGETAYKEALIEIFSKVTGYQEKIIYLLKKLQSDLLDTSTWDTIEKKRREKNIMEFSTRFSRNYVYQIERMIEEIRVFTVEDFRKKKYSETLYVKVCGLYGLLYQALNSYINQLKYFIFNQYPKKLDILICMISTATKICIQKKFFDKDDALVRVIFEHCESLLNYINDLEENRKVITREILPKSQQKVQNSKWDQIAAPQAKLSMYDTLRAGSSGLDLKKKINTKPKKSKTKLRVSSTRTIPIKAEECLKESQNISSEITEESQCETKEQGQKRLNTFLRPKIHKINKKRCDSPRNDSPQSITTQIEKIMVENESSSIHLNEQTPRSIGDKSSPIKSNRKNYNSNGNENLNTNQLDENLNTNLTSNKDLLRNILLELQAITKKEVKQVLSPLLNHIGSITKSSPQNAATILNKLNSQLINLTDNTSESMSFNQKSKSFIKEELKKTYQCFNDKENTSTNSVKDLITIVNNLNDNVNNGQQNTDRTDGQQETIILTNKQQIEAFENFSQRKLLNNKQKKKYQSEENLQHKIESECNLGDKNDVIGSMDVFRNANQMEEFEIEVGYGSSRITTGVVNRNNHYSESETKPVYALNGCGDEIVRTTNNNLQPQRDDNIQQVLYERNIQYTFIRSSSDIDSGERQSDLSLLQSEHDELTILKQNSDKNDEFSSIPNSPREVDNNLNDNNLKNLEKIFETRLEFIKKIAENPLYVNENFQDPWKIIGRISDKLITELTTAAEKDINFGEENFITDFINMELNC